jgi:hypothetical protein
MLKDHIFSRKEQQFFTSAILEIKSQLVEDGLRTEVEFAQVVDNLCHTFLEYIENWGKTFEDLHNFKWALLNNAPWHEVQKCLQNIVKVDINVLKVVDEDDLFSEVNHVRNICAAKIETWKKCRVKISESWTETFQIIKNEDIRHIVRKRTYCKEKCRSSSSCY